MLFVATELKNLFIGLITTTKLKTVTKLKWNGGRPLLVACFSQIHHLLVFGGTCYKIRSLSKLTNN